MRCHGLLFRRHILKISQWKYLLSIIIYYLNEYFVATSGGAEREVQLLFWEILSCTVASSEASKTHFFIIQTLFERKPSPRLTAVPGAVREILNSVLILFDAIGLVKCRNPGETCRADCLEATRPRFRHCSKCD